MNEGKDKDNGRSIEEAECVGLNSSAVGEETTLRGRQSKKDARVLILYTSMIIMSLRERLRRYMES